MLKKKERDASQKPPQRFVSLSEANERYELVMRLIGELVKVLGDNDLTPEMRCAKVLALRAIIDG